MHAVFGPTGATPGFSAASGRRSPMSYLVRLPTATSTATTPPIAHTRRDADRRPNIGSVCRVRAPEQPHLRVVTFATWNSPGESGRPGNSHSDAANQIVGATFVTSTLRSP